MEYKVGQLVFYHVQTLDITEGKAYKITDVISYLGASLIFFNDDVGDQRRVFPETLTPAKLVRRRICKTSN